MIELLAAGDPDAGERFWAEHLRQGGDYLIDYLRVAEEAR